MNSKAIGPALGRVPSGLFVVTYLAGEIEQAMLASWVQQCSFEPPMLSVAVKQGRGISDWLTEGANFVVNVLAEGQTDLISHFGKGACAERIAEPAVACSQFSGGCADPDRCVGSHAVRGSRPLHPGRSSSRLRAGACKRNPRRCQAIHSHPQKWTEVLSLPWATQSSAPTRSEARDCRRGSR